ncbi:MAG: RNA-binding cell elongation regulator Jag/EloR [Dehalococcoidia bacterium]
MAGVEASGKTIDEAIESALEELGAERDEVDVKVLSEGRGGILGVGSEPARVRVRLLSDPGGEEDEDDGQRPARDVGDNDDEEGELIEDEAEYAARMLDHMLELMGVRADVSIRDAETPGDGLGMAKAVLDVEGEDLGVLIGRRGETLAALQFVLNMMVTKQLGEKFYFTVDIEGYRRRRERQLETLARRMAEQVKRTRRPVTLEPMPANERRIIHITLANDRYVSTSSEGEGENRKVSIEPGR